MDKDTEQVLKDMNDAVRNNGSAVASVPAAAAAPAAQNGHTVDAVTSGTMKNNVYLPPMPVLFPPAPIKKED